MGANWDEWYWTDDMADPALRQEIERLGELMIAAASADEAALADAQFNVTLAVNRVSIMRPWTVASGCRGRQPVTEGGALAPTSEPTSPPQWRSRGHVRHAA